MSRYWTGALFTLGLYLGALANGKSHSVLDIILGCLFWPVTLGMNVYWWLQAGGLV